MHNPFALLTPALVAGLLKGGQTYFVRQTYKRGIDHFNTELKGAYLISYYNDISRANIHMEALGHDPARFLYDMSIPQHKERLVTASRQPEGYAVFVTLFPEKKWMPPADMKNKIKRYVGRFLNWKPGRDDTVETKLFSQFGEVFITLKYQVHEVKIPLSDIEKL